MQKQKIDIEGMMDVSIIIVNYRTSKLTKHCIESIFANTSGVEFEIIVVDNFSGDDSVGILSSVPGIKLVTSDSNLGFGKANNLGLGYCSGKYIFLLNSDTVILNNAVRNFYDYMETTHEKTAVIGANLIGADGAPCHSYGSLPSISQSLAEIASILFRRGRINDNKQFYGPVGYVTGADMFIRRSVIDRLGLFDPDFFMYFEDSELQCRYSRHSYLSVIVMGPEIVHLEGQSSDGGNKTLSFWKMYFNSKFLYLRKCYPDAKYLIARAVCLLYLPLFIFKGYGTKGCFSLILQFFLPVKKDSHA